MPIALVWPISELKVETVVSWETNSDTLLLWMSASIYSLQSGRKNKRKNSANRKLPLEQYTGSEKSTTTAEDDGGENQQREKLPLVGLHERAHTLIQIGIIGRTIIGLARRSQVVASDA